MSQPNIILDPTVLASFESLKRTARSEHDIALWFREHLSLLDPLYADLARDIHVNFTADDIMDPIAYPERDHLRRFRVSMVRHQYPAPLTPLMEALGGFNILGGSQKWLFPVDITEWSLLVADLAVKFAMQDSWQQYAEEERTHAEAILAASLPEHFSGLTPPLLLTLCETGLFERDTRMQMHQKLFALRSKPSNLVSLPSNLDMFP